MRKKVTLLINYLSVGGAERVCITLANGLVEMGYNVQLVVFNVNDSAQYNQLKDQVEIINLNIRSAKRSMIPLISYIKKRSPSKLIVFQRQIAVVLVIIRKLFRFNFKIIARNITFLSESEKSKTGLWHGLIVKYLVKRFYAESDLFIAQTNKMALDLSQYLHVDRNKIRVIYNPLSSTIKDFIHFNKNKIRHDGGYLLCVGHLERVKAFHVAIEAFAQIGNFYPQLRLKIVGDGTLKSELKKQAVKLGVGDKVDLEGYQTDIIPYFLAAKATLLSSLYEGFPNVLAESIALGTPVVAFDCPSGPGEIIKENENGFLVKYQDVHDMANNIHKVLAREWDPEVVRRTVTHLDSNKIVDQYVQVISEG